ncbi:MAG: hypothetical protein KC635_26010, partial [Myxococcales bacterium]|nr:hypothetical protein [Myxococcales bacterium]
LAWLGLDWDEGPDVGGAHGPYRQSERLDRYDHALASLEARGVAYRCHCSRADVLAAQSAPHLPPRRRVAPDAVEPGEWPYPGTCRPRDGASALSGGRARFHVEGLGEDARVTWRDGDGRAYTEDVRTTCGDFVLGREGEPSYQLAVVVDDIAMGITDVVRGADLLGSTARQILLHRALGVTPPSFSHHPLLVDADGRKLSKRDGDLAIAELRRAGVAPGALCATLGRAVGLFGAAVLEATPRDVADALAARAPGDALHDGVLAASDLDALGGRDA